MGLHDYIFFILPIVNLCEIFTTPPLHFTAHLIQVNNV